MKPILVVVMDGAKARFLTLEENLSPGYEESVRLTEVGGVSCPTHDTSGQELWSSSKTGRNRGSAGQAHSYDDHRENHMTEFERRFAQDTVSQMMTITDRQSIHQVLLVAESKILGLMREALAGSASASFRVNELAKNLCHLSPSELHTYLAGKNLIPARKGSH